MALTHRVGWDARFMQRSPWFWPLGRAAERFSECADWPTREDLDRMYLQLCSAPDIAPLRFADNVRKQDKRSAGRLLLDRLYDGRIATCNEVPTRERDWHDFFNALCFATFPRAKAALHRRQFEVLQRRVPAGATRLPPTRIPEQDALTLFDEGGAAIAAEPAACRELLDPAPDRSARLHAALERGQARVVPFGHALFEHMVEGLRCPGGFTRIIELPSLPLADATLLSLVDSELAKTLANPACFQTPSEGAHLRLDDLQLAPVRE